MIMFRDVKRIIFDLDNTLIKHNFDLEFECISKHCLVKDGKEFKKQLGDMFKFNSKYLIDKKITKEYFAYVIEILMPILKSMNMTGYELLELIDKYHAGTLMDNAKEILEYLNGKGYQVVALTNWFYDYQMQVLRKLGISEYFERIYAYDNYYAKPNRYAMLRALDGTKPQNNVLIGDDASSDINAAKKMGIKAIGFNVDYSKCKMIRKADVDITNLIDIKKYL